MKREIKFRGKAIYGDLAGKWVCGSYVFDYDKRPMILTAGYSHTGSAFSGCYLVEPDTVGQFTGLLDKDRKEIYEGDILGFTTKREMGFPTDGIKIALSVVFGKYNPDNDSTSEYMGFWAEGSYGYRSSIAYQIGSHGAKVIGNIHDNSELTNSL